MTKIMNAQGLMSLVRSIFSINFVDEIIEQNGINSNRKARRHHISQT